MSKTVVEDYVSASVEATDQNDFRALTETTDYQLAKVGKKAVLRQNFGFLSMFALSATTMGTWEGIVLLFSTAFNNGGYLGSFIGIWLVFIGTLCSTATMAEMVSMAPTAGGQYHWVDMLAPKSSRKLLSYIAAWLTVINWQSSVAGSAFAAAQTIQGMVSLGTPSYVPEQWQIPLIFWALCIIAFSINTFAAKSLPMFENTILVVHVGGFFATFIPLLILGAKTDSSIVFGTWANEGGWSSQGVSFMVGLVGAAYAFTGADSAAHMVEEVGNAAVRVPQAMVYGVLLNGTMGVTILLTMLYVLGDPQAVFNTTLAFPAYQVYLNAIKSVAGTVVLAMIILIITVASIVTFTATASRLTWAFSRDRGVPGWRRFSRIDTRINLPLWSIYLTMIISFVLSFIAFGSSLAFNDVVSLGVSSSYVTYILGNSLLLWRRLGGYIKPYSASGELTNTAKSNSLSWGPWKLPEPIGIAANVFGILYMIVATIFSFFPTAVEPDAAGMNWSSFMLGIVMIFSIAWYYIGGCKEYDGPVIEIEPEHVETISQDDSHKL